MAALETVNKNEPPCVRSRSGHMQQSCNRTQRYPGTGSAIETEGLEIRTGTKSKQSDLLMPSMQNFDRSHDVTDVTPPF